MQVVSFCLVYCSGELAAARLGMLRKAGMRSAVTALAGALLWGCTRNSCMAVSCAFFLQATTEIQFPMPARLNESIAEEYKHRCMH